MKLLFLGDGNSASEMLEWTAKIWGGGGGIFVSGDEIVATKANQLQISFYTLEEIYEIVASEKICFDIAVSFLYGKIIRNPLINSVRLGCINFHPAPLPDYKGRAGCSFAILDKLSEWGCTAHYIDTGIDTGNIIKVDKFLFDWKTETAISLKEKTIEKLKRLYQKIIVKVKEQNCIIENTKQNPNDGKYISTTDMLSAMEIKSDDDIDAKIQAFWFPPHQGAYITLNERKYMLINDVVMNQISEQIK